MSKGKTIEILLVNGNPSGLRKVSILGNTIQAFACYRSKISSLMSRDEISKPGIYFLIGKENITGEIYIGETKDLSKRIKDYMNEEFWNQVIVFVSVDNRLHKGYISILEAEIISDLKQASRVKVRNKQNPDIEKLAEAQMVFINEFKENLFLILGTLGYPNINEMLNIPNKEDITSPDWKPESIDDFVFVIKRKKRTIAQMVVTPTGYLLLSGSTILEESESFKNDPSLRSSRNKRNELFEKKVIFKDVRIWKLKEGVLLGSPSAAAEVVLGTSANGREEWKTPEGKTLDKIEKEFL